MKKAQLLIITTLLTLSSFAQTTFNYTLKVEPFQISNLPGLHSFAFAQYDGKWLLLGGRIDGLHARQPFNAFPASGNNKVIYVIDPITNQKWERNVSELPTAIAEQLQSSNPQFCQDGETLYYLGGYCFSVTANDHITFDKLTAIQVPELMNAIINNAPVNSYFKQISDTAFAVTGGHLVKMNDRFYLVGGHRFDGRYNPMGNPTYVQKYTNQIRSFKINNTGSQLSISEYQVISDPVHLRRRDYNLISQIFPGGTEGFTISSGVFQENADLPFLYPVDVTPTGYQPITTFNQYLSNYHTANVSLYENDLQQMHTLFFGGISRYYYNNGVFTQDDNVPFVKTISRLSRGANGIFEEYNLPIEMPAYHGASAEFFINTSLPHTNNDVIKLNEIMSDTILLGYVVGGINSTTINPFSQNQTSQNTSANSTHYRVKLIRNKSVGEIQVNGINPYSFSVFPNPNNGSFTTTFKTNKPGWVHYFVTDLSGRNVLSGSWEYKDAGNKKERIRLQNTNAQDTLILTLVFEDKYYVTQKIALQQR